ncbi:methyltransferase domain-containing protein [Micromonospora sp. BRA006-A]|nr:methyltransferase domain-containing protein [Micromonospora sp. BRA006-A]
MIEEREQDAAVKARHRAMWAMGDHAAVAAQVIPELGRRWSGPPGWRRACGCWTWRPGPATRPARGPGRCGGGGRRPHPGVAGDRAGGGRAGGLDADLGGGGREALPYADAAFDAVLSCVGVMFAPRHRAAADEVLRVCRPGGTIGLVNWTPEGFVGQLFAAMRPYAPPPPPGAQPPPLWGDEEHVRELFGDRVDAFTSARDAVVVDRFATPGSSGSSSRPVTGPLWRSTGRTRATRRTAGLDRALTDLAARHLDGGVMRWEYLLVTAPCLTARRPVDGRRAVPAAVLTRTRRGWRRACAGSRRAPGRHGRAGRRCRWS